MRHVLLPFILSMILLSIGMRGPDPVPPSYPGADESDLKRCDHAFDTACVSLYTWRYSDARQPYPFPTFGLFQKHCTFVDAYNQCWFWRPGTGYNYHCWVREYIQCDPWPTRRGFCFLLTVIMWFMSSAT